MAAQALSAETASTLKKNVASMNDVASGFDVVIVCTGNEAQEQWWQARLEAVRGQIMPKDSVVVAVHEDWEGGAGNALGTLYAYVKARRQLAPKVDLDALLREGKSVGLFHTAGKGTRLAPLPGAENNNKPGVRLPAVVTVGAKSVNMTILESVVKQVGVYAASRGGRVSVFWGDQVFIPSVSPTYNPASHADILCKLGPMLSREQWAERGMEKYGLIVSNETGAAAQVEKVNYDTAQSLLSGFGTLAGVGVSLGSFSVSSVLLLSLLDEFSTELKEKKGKLDSDPHLWMPMTLSRESYLMVMQKKGVDKEFASSHYARMAAFKEKLPAFSAQAKGILSAVDVGMDCYWWDYGQLKLYLGNNKKALLASTPAEKEEGDMIRAFFLGGNKGNAATSSLDAGGNWIVASKVGAGSKVESSVLSSCSLGAGSAVNDCMMVAVTAKKVTGSGFLLYNVVDDSEEGLEMKEGDVRADVFIPSIGKKITMRTNVKTDSGQSWKVKLEQYGNEYSFEEVYKMNFGVEVDKAVAMAMEAHAELATKL